MRERAFQRNVWAAPIPKPRGTGRYTESGNPQLRPETSESLGKFTLTVDRWRLHQVGIVGVVGFDTIAVEDYLNRVKGGAGSANFLRTAPTVDDVAFYAGSVLAPADAPTLVNDTFKNLQPQTIEGWISVSPLTKSARSVLV